MTDDIRILHETTSEGGRFRLDRNGSDLGYLRYSGPQDGVITLEHTEVDDSLRGQGRARQLLDTAIEWVRKNELRIISDCGYATKQFDRDESIRDVLADGST